ANSAAAASGAGVKRSIDRPCPVEWCGRCARPATGRQGRCSASGWTGFAAWHGSTALYARPQGELFVENMAFGSRSREGSHLSWGWRMRFWGAALIVPVLVAAAGTAYAQDDTAGKFGVRESVRQVSISPDGERLAVIQPAKGAGSVVSVITIATGESQPVLTAKGGSEQLGRCDWALPTRLVCSVHVINRSPTGLAGFSRLLALDADGQNMQMLSDKMRVRAQGASQFGGSVIDWSDEDGSGRVLMTRYQSGEYQTGSLLGRSGSGLAVDAVDTVSLKRKTVESPKDGVVDYISDGRGHVRMMISQTETADGYTGNTYNISYRKTGSRDWQSFGTYVSEAGLSSGFLPVAIDPALDLVYGFDALNGRSALYS